MRLALALYLMIVTAAGPWACCCTLARLATKLSAKSTSDAAPAESHSCCKQKAPRVPSPEEHDRKDPGRSDCPCKQAGDCSSHLIATSHDESRDATLRVLAGAAASLFSPEFSVLTGAAHAALPSSGAPRGSLSSLSKDDLLHVHHMLRC